MHRLKINLIKVEKVLSPTQISIAPFVINPYRGCSYGCLYCYSKYNKVFRTRNKIWGSFLDVKFNIYEVLKKELSLFKPKRVLLGSTTEVFLPQEKRYRLTYRVLKILNRFKIPYTILTRSPHLINYIDLIKENSLNKIYFTVNFLDFNHKRLFEPFIDYDLESLCNTFRLLKKNNIKFRIHISPYLGELIDIKEIVKIFREFTDEFFLEVYNPILGSWDLVKKVIKVNFSDFYEKIIQNFQTQESYGNFCRKIQKEIAELSSQYDIKFSYLFPEYKRFYTSDILYE